MKSFVLFLAFAFPQTFPECLAQNFKQPASDTIVYNLIKIEEPPVLLTPEKKYTTVELTYFIRQNQKWPHPRLDCQGTVVISFIVEPDSSISNVNYQKKLCPYFDEEALRIVELMNVWKPGKINCEAIRARLNVPISFRIER